MFTWISRYYYSYTMEGETRLHMHFGYIHTTFCWQISPNYHQSPQRHTLHITCGSWVAITLSVGLFFFFMYIWGWKISILGVLILGCTNPFFLFMVSSSKFVFLFHCYNFLAMVVVSPSPSHKSLLGKPSLDLFLQFQCFSQVLGEAFTEES